MKAPREPWLPFVVALATITTAALIAGGILALILSGLVDFIFNLHK